MASSASDTRASSASAGATPSGRLTLHAAQPSCQHHEAAGTRARETRARTRSRRRSSGSQPSTRRRCRRKRKQQTRRTSQQPELVSGLAVLRAPCFVRRTYLVLAVLGGQHTLRMCTPYRAVAGYQGTEAEYGVLLEAAHDGPATSAEHGLGAAGEWTTADPSSAPYWIRTATDYVHLRAAGHAHFSRCGHWAKAGGEAASSRGGVAFSTRLAVLVSRDEPLIRDLHVRHEARPTAFPAEFRAKTAHGAGAAMRIGLRQLHANAAPLVGASAGLWQASRSCCGAREKRDERQSQALCK